jgi:hypothetical protein
MKNTPTRLWNALENELAAIGRNGQPRSAQVRSSILICKKAMRKLRNYMASEAFPDPAEEIDFFKTIKPAFYSSFIYYINVYDFIMKYPAGGEEAREQYIRLHLAELKTFFDHNQAFYQYYRAGLTHLDEQYFVRGSFNVSVEMEDFEEDQQYSTSHDYKLSKIIANEKFGTFLDRELAKLNLGTGDKAAEFFPLAHPAWTASHTDAVELIYALKASGAVNNGNIDISELVALFEFLFRMELKEYYHKFTDITRRKKDVPVFLHKLKDGLLRWIDSKFAL